MCHLAERPDISPSGHAFNCYWFFLPESGSALPGQHRFLPVHVQIVGCGANALSDLHFRRPDKTRKRRLRHGAPNVGCGVNTLSDLDPRRPDKTRSVASGMGAPNVGCGVNALSRPTLWIPVGRTRRVSVASGMGAVLLLRLSKTLADDLQPLTNLSVFNSGAIRMCSTLYIRAAGENQALIAGASHDLGGEFCVRFAVVAIFKQLDGDHRSQPAYVADSLRVFFGYRQQSVFQLLPTLLAFCSRSSCSNTFNTSSQLDAGNRVTRIGAAQTAWSDGIHHFRAPGDARQRKPPAIDFAKVVRSVPRPFAPSQTACRYAPRRSALHRQSA